MKRIIISISFLLASFILFGQNIINNDTTIRITISLNKAFDLKFEDWPSPGIIWYLPDSSNASELSIKLIKQELKEGEKPEGGKYISTYNYKIKAKGEYILEYFYGRLWLKEKSKKCIVKINVE